jgi:hypothetical protein
MIGRADGVRAVSTINTNATFRFAYCPLERVKEKTQNKENEEFRENNMKRLRFLGCELGFDVRLVLVDFWMVIILDASLELRGMANESAYKRDAFGGDALGAWEIRRRQTLRMPLARRILKTMKGIDPIAMTIGVLACQPADKIAIDEVKSQECAAKETGP